MSPYTVLLVDSNKTERLAVATMLEAASYSVIQADDGDRALELFVEDSPDMVITDVLLKGLGGYDLVSEIKRLSISRFIPVLFITALRDSDSLVKCVSCGGDDFMVKPYEYDIFLVKMVGLRRIQAMHEEIIDANNTLKRHDSSLQSELSLAEHVYDYMVGSGGGGSDLVRYFRASASRFSGDIFLSAYTPSGTLNVILCDFSGHGLYAAIGAIPVSDLFYAMTKKGFHIEDIVKEINNKLCAIFPVEMFCAAVLVEVSPACEYISIWNGGMPDVYIRSNERTNMLAQSLNIPLGVSVGDDFNSKPLVVKIEGGERLYLTSDGVLVEKNKDGEKLGEKGFSRLLRTIISDDYFGEVCREVTSMSEGNGHADDVSIVEIFLSPELFPVDVSKANEVSSSVPRHWQIDMKLYKDVFRDVSLAPFVSNVVNSVQSMTGHKENVFTVIAEMVNNAVDHGVLGLDSSLKRDPEGFAQYFMSRDERLLSDDDGWVSVSIGHHAENDQGVLELTVEDSGSGFDVNLKDSDMSENAGYCGRGLPLIKKLCKSLVFNKKGNCATATYRWDVE